MHVFDMNGLPSGCASDPEVGPVVIARRGHDDGVSHLYIPLVVQLALK